MVENLLVGGMLNKCIKTVGLRCFRRLSGRLIQLVLFKLIEFLHLLDIQPDAFPMLLLVLLINFLLVVACEPVRHHSEEVGVVLDRLRLQVAWAHNNFDKPLLDALRVTFGAE